LFRSAARAFGSRVVGVILTGGLDDGSEGLLLVQRQGGVAIVQDPGEAEAPSMPASALELVPADFVLPLAQVPAVLSRLANNPSQPAPTPPPPEPDPLATDSNDEEEEDELLRPPELSGAPVAIGCPDCNGALWRTRDGKVVKYRCHVGHSFTEKGLMAAKDEEVELALWTALRVLKEKAAMCRAILDRPNPNRARTSVQHFQQELEQADWEADVIRKALMTDAAAPQVDKSRTN
ncbi:MAG: chemotaxis protein CheB, partial [Candidatus Saccharimonadales bacterium]